MRYLLLLVLPLTLLSCDILGVGSEDKEVWVSHFEYRGDGEILSTMKWDFEDEIHPFKYMMKSQCQDSTRVFREATYEVDTIKSLSDDREGGVTISYTASSHERGACSKVWVEITYDGNIVKSDKIEI